MRRDEIRQAAAGQHVPAGREQLLGRRVGETGSRAARRRRTPRWDALQQDAGVAGPLRAARYWPRAASLGRIRSRSFAELIGTSAAVPKFVAEDQVADQGQTRLARVAARSSMSAISRAAGCRSGAWQGCTPSHSSSPPAAVSASAAPCPSNMRTWAASPVLRRAVEAFIRHPRVDAVRVVIGAERRADCYRAGDGRARAAGARRRRRRAAGHGAARPGKPGRAGARAGADPRRGTAAGIGRGDRPGRRRARPSRGRAAGRCRWSTA